MDIQTYRSIEMTNAMKKVEHDDQYWVEGKPFSTLQLAWTYAAMLARSERRSIAVYQNGELVRLKRY